MNRWSLLIAALAVSACGSGPVVLTHQETSPAYTTGQFAYAAAGRDLRVVVVGNPFGGQPAAFERAVTDAMQGQHWGQRTHFTIEPGDSARDAYRVVLLFNPPDGVTGGALCGDRPPRALPDGDPGGRVGVFGAFCRSDKILTRVRGTVDGAAGPNDPLFRELVGQVTNALFPLRQRHDDQDRCKRLLIC